MGSHTGERLLCHTGDLRAPGTMSGGQRADEGVLHVSAKEDPQAAVGVRSSLATAAATPLSSCALLRNLGVRVAGFGPHSCLIPKLYLFIPFMDTTMLAASGDEIIPLFFPLVDFHDG